MKIHNLIHNSPDVPTPVSAVTMPEGTYGSTVATRRFDGTAWRVEDVPEWQIDEHDNVLIEFSDGSLGVCLEERLADALAMFDLQLVTS